MQNTRTLTLNGMQPRLIQSMACAFPCNDNAKCLPLCVLGGSLFLFPILIIKYLCWYQCVLYLSPSGFSFRFSFLSILVFCGGGISRLPVSKNPAHGDSGHNRKVFDLPFKPSRQLKSLSFLCESVTGW